MGSTPISPNGTVVQRLEQQKNAQVRFLQRSPFLDLLAQLVEHHTQNVGYGLEIHSNKKVTCKKTTGRSLRKIDKKP